MSVKYSLYNSENKECEVVLLDNSRFVTAFDQEIVLGRDLFDQVCQRVGVAVDNKQYFGLQYIDREDGGLNWLKLYEEIPRSKRKSEAKLYQFAVKVFPQEPLELERAEQRQILLQLKVLINRGKFSLSGNKHAQIDGLCVQAELGDFNTKRHKQGYLEELLGFSVYSPPTSINTDDVDISIEQYEAMVRNLHKSHRGMSPQQAIAAALGVCKELPNYGMSLHYDATDQVSGKGVVFCVSRHGIRICQLKSELPEVGEVCHNFHWRDVISMSCDNSKFLMFLTQTREIEEENMLCQVYRFNKGLYGHKAAQRLLLDAENHQMFFFKDDPDRATIIRSLSGEVKAMKRSTRSVRIGSIAPTAGLNRAPKKNPLASRPRGMSLK